MKLTISAVLTPLFTFVFRDFSQCLRLSRKRWCRCTCATSAGATSRASALSQHLLEHMLRVLKMSPPVYVGGVSALAAQPTTPPLRHYHPHLSLRKLPMLRLEWLVLPDL